MNKRLSTALLLVLGVVQLMGALVALGVLMSWGVTNPFRYWSDPALRQLENPELILLLGLMIYLFSTGFLIAVLETRLRAPALSRRTSLLGLLPIIGVASPFFIRREPSHLTHLPSRTDGQLIPAIIAVGLAGLMVIFGVFWVTQWRGSARPSSSVSAAQANIAAFLAIKDISKAQSSYKLYDWDGDGDKEYALFIVHLWRTGRLKKDPIDVNLIPEELAVARVPEFAYQGFLFRNLHSQDMAPLNAPGTPLAGETPARKLDYGNEWALIADPEFTPKEDDPNQVLQFIAFSDNRIFARPYKADIIKSIPFEYEKEWTLLSSIAEIDRLQRKSALSRSDE